MEGHHSRGVLPGHEDIYEEGEAPWEKLNRENRNMPGFERAEPHSSNWDPIPRPRIGNLTGYELMMFYEGDTRPLKMRLEKVPLGAQRDAAIAAAQGELSLAIDGLDFALETHVRGDTDYINRCTDRIKYLQEVYDELYKDFSAE